MGVAGTSVLRFMLILIYSDVCMDGIGKKHEWFGFVGMAIGMAMALADL